jgi:hypothetical protein
MAKFVMLPCKVREDRIVPQKQGEPVELTGLQVIERFLLDMRSPADLLAFRSLSPNSFIGLVKSALNGRPIRFYIRNTDLSGDISWILKRDPTFAARLLEVWKIDSAAWDSRVIEAP